MQKMNAAGDDGDVAKKVVDEGFAVPLAIL
jgi:hypothetical protein